MITETARAKVNLTLEIRGRRPDGYHELVSLVAFPDVGDIVTLDPEAPFSLQTDGAFAAAIDGENLIAKACRLVSAIRPQSSLGRITLTKQLPVAAGVGGGSADAAAVLRALMRSGLDLTPSELLGIAAGLGADVTVCLEQRTASMWGIGERVAHVPELPPFWMVLANPGVPLATADVFRALKAAPLCASPTAPDVPGPFASVNDLAAWIGARGNDLQAPAVVLCPAIADVLAALHDCRGCLLAAQSGSGPTCFGVFADEASARAATERLAATRPRWWLAAAAVGAGRAPR